MKCDRCGKKGLDEYELFHPADLDCNEYYPDQKFCEYCSMQIEQEEYDKLNPKLSIKESFNGLKKALGF